MKNKLFTICMLLLLSITNIRIINAEDNKYGKVIMIGDSYASQTYKTNCTPGKIGEPSKNACRADATWGDKNSETNAWPGKVKELLSLDHNDIYFSNKGGTGFSRPIDGITYFTMLENSTKKFKQDEVSLIIVVGFANDAKVDDYSKNSESKMSTFVERAHELYPNAKILLAPVGWLKYSESQLKNYANGWPYEKDEVKNGQIVKGDHWEDRIQRNMTEYIIPAAKAVAKEYSYVHYVTDSKTIFEGKEKQYFTGARQVNCKIVGEDPIHPNIAGQELIANDIANYIVQLYSEKPAKPELTAIYNSANGIDIRFKKVQGATSYVFFRKWNGVWKEVAEVKAKDLPTDNGNLKYIDSNEKESWGKGFYYAVAAVKNNIRSDFETNGKNVLKIYRVNTVDIKSAVQSGTSVKLNWTKVNYSGYEIQYSSDNGKTWQSTPVINDTNTTSTEIKIKDFKKNTTYVFRIRAFKNSNKDIPKCYSPWSSWEKITLK